MASDTATRKTEPGPILEQEETQRPRHKRWWSPITLRILAVNVLALGILVGGTLYLSQYQKALLQAELETLRVEARLFANALAEGAVIRMPRQRHMMLPELARPMVRRMVETTEKRTRLFNEHGTMVADSYTLMGAGGVVLTEELPPITPRFHMLNALNNFVELLGRALPADSLSETESRMSPAPYARGRRAYDYDDAEQNDIPEWRNVADALRGDESVRFYTDSQGKLVLAASAPVQRFKHVLGAVLVTADGSRIETAMREVRTAILQAFGAAFLITILLSFYLSRTISDPLHRLSKAADRVRHGQGFAEELPNFSSRHDEIGDLSVALRQMTRALSDRMLAIERFAADVAHEIKNPLTSLRSAVETAARIDDPDKQKKLMGIIQDDVARLDRLISDISNASRLDAEISRASFGPVDLRRVLSMLHDVHSTMHETDPQDDSPRVVLDIDDKTDLTARGAEDQIVQVLQNIIHNGLSFSPPGGTVTISAERKGNCVTLRICDQGPGIPEDNLKDIFKRFYSERPQQEKFGTHSGLGLSISKQIIDAHNGRIYAENHKDDDGNILGARFIIELPACKQEKPG